MHKFTALLLALICLILAIPYATDAREGGLTTTVFLPFVTTPYETALVSMSRERGIYSAPFSVFLNAQPGNTEIYYTLDGSVPSASNGTLYDGRVRIDGTTTLRATAVHPTLPNAPVQTHTYLFVTDTIDQRGIPQGYPLQWNGTPADYEMDAEIVSVSPYQFQIATALTAIPSMSLVLDKDSLFGSNGIYLNSEESGAGWERAVSAEFLSNDPSIEQFQVDAGLEIHGGASRIPTASPKHSFRLKFKKIYGPGELKYDLFENNTSEFGAVKEFDTLILRARYNLSWISGNTDFDQRRRALYMRDQWMRDAQAAMGQPSTHGRWVHLYLNGQYWGLFNLHERPDADFMSEYFGGDKDTDWDVIESGEAKDGDLNAWNAMFSIAKTAGSNANVVRDIEAYLDVENFIDYIILNHTAGNTDWYFHNWYAARRREPGAGFKFFSWDAEWVWLSENENWIEPSFPNSPSELFELLREDATFRVALADRIHKHLFSDGALTPANNIARFDTLVNTVSGPVIAESARWGDYRRDTFPEMGPFQLYTRNGSWITERDRVRNSYFPVRTGIVIQQYKDAGLYPSIEPPNLTLEGGLVTPGTLTVITKPITETAAIWYTTDGRDPRAANGSPQGNFSPTNVSVFLSSSTIVKARLFNPSTGEWSALTSAEYFIPTGLANVIVSELMYHPVDGSEFEFIELKNTDDGTVDLSGVYFGDSIEYVFPLGTTIAPGDHLVIAKDPIFFAEKYGFSPANATGYAGKFSNGGERVALTHPDGSDFIEFSYEDGGTWPSAADGDGYSLVSADPDDNPDHTDPENWRQSTNIDGSPNADDPPPVR